MCALPTGEWDWILDLARDELILNSRVAGSEALGAAAVVRAFRGEVHAADEILASLAPLLETSSDPQDRAIQNAYTAGVALAAGRYADSIALGLAIDRNVGLDVTVAYRTIGMAAHAALADRSAEVANALLAKLLDLAIHGRWARATRRTIEGGVAALEGRTGEATAAYTDAVRIWRDLDLPLELALCGVEMAELLPDAQAIAGVIAEARQAAEELHATRLLERLDAAPRRAATAPKRATEVASPAH
jgi:hypothetical protein